MAKWVIPTNEFDTTSARFFRLSGRPAAVEIEWPMRKAQFGIRFGII
jgi:hypothetical protein